MMIHTFLDIDGVVNHARYLATPVSRIEYPPLDPECVRRLDGFLTRTGSHVVVSSTWRLYLSLEQISQALITKGLSESNARRLVGTTPDIPYVNRGMQIDTWLRHRLPSVDVVIIFDDDEDVSPLDAHLVKTDFNVGLTDDDVALAETLIARHQR